MNDRELETRHYGEMVTMCWKLELTLTREN